MGVGVLRLGPGGEFARSWPTGEGATMAEHGEPRVRVGERRAGQQFGTWLAELVERLGISQAELARRAGVEPAMIERICRGETVPLYPTAVAVIKAVIEVAMQRGTGLGHLRGRDLLRALAPVVHMHAGFRHDGREDGEELAPAAAASAHQADAMLILTLEALAREEGAEGPRDRGIEGGGGRPCP